MKQKLIAVLAGLIVGGSALAQGIPMPVEKLGETVNQQNGETVPFYKGYGSSIDADPKNPRRFYGLTDRGPNADGGGNVKIFLQPSFTPSIGHFEIQRDGSIRKLRTIPLKNAQGKPLTGLPNPAGYGTSKEQVVDADKHPLERDINGIDSEGLAVMKDGTFWVSDEYGPHIVHFNKNGIELERMSPRGVKSEVSNKSLVLILSFDLKTGQSKQYLYRQGGDYWKNSEIRAIDENRFLVNEHNGTTVKHVYLIDLRGATDVSDKNDGDNGLLVNGKPLEQNSWEELEAAGIHPVSKTLVVDVQKQMDFPHEKFEGMWVADNGKTLWIINDDDFGIDSQDDKYIVPKRLPDGSTDATHLYRIPLNLQAR